MEINLSDDDFKIIGNAITWTLYTPFYKSAPPELSGHERGRLQLIFDSICRLRQEVGNILEGRINEMELNVQNCSLTSNREVIRHIIVCLRSFYNEIGHSPNEVLAVTGMPISQLDSLLERLSSLNRSEDNSFTTWHR